ncbi:MAG TPA: hypothetical protein V6D04_09370, partial [Candidatus Obscuribacterales bacterium]
YYVESLNSEILCAPSAEQQPTNSTRKSAGICSCPLWLLSCDQWEKDQVDGCPSGRAIWTSESAEGVKDNILG